MTTTTLKEKLQTGTLGHKWRPGHMKQLLWGRWGAQGGYINDDRDTGNVRRKITDRDTGTQMTTRTQGI